MRFMFVPVAALVAALSPSVSQAQTPFEGPTGLNATGFVAGPGQYSAGGSVWVGSVPAGSTVRVYLQHTRNDTGAYIEQRAYPPVIDGNAVAQFNYAAPQQIVGTYSGSWTIRCQVVVVAQDGSWQWVMTNEIFVPGWTPPAPGGGEE